MAKQAKDWILKIFGVILFLIGLLPLFNGSIVWGLIFFMIGGIVFYAGHNKTSGTELTPEQKIVAENKSKNIKSIFAILFAVGAIYIGNKITSGIPEQPASTPPPPTQNTVSPEAKQVAQKQLDAKMTLLENDGMVTSYSFSPNTENVVFVSALWYQTPVTLKKDILASLASLKDQAGGNHRFVVRDTYSNEIVGEVTAFSGSIEVYK